MSYSTFGTGDSEGPRKVREAVRILSERVPDLEVEGEMNADAALNEDLRQRIFPNSHLTGQANLLVLPNLDAANNAFNLLKVLGDGLPVGPILMGAAKPVQVVTPSITARGLVNISALAVVDAQTHAARNGEE
jgi:malate dehydrogenase (oxaloacetate-decarboxylating)(NADP+)